MTSVQSYILTQDLSILTGFYNNPEFDDYRQRVVAGNSAGQNPAIDIEIKNIMPE